MLIVLKKSRKSSFIPVWANLWKWHVSCKPLIMFLLATYILSYRNDEIPLLSVDGGKVKGKWIYLDSQCNYSDALDFMFQEIGAIDAVNGN